MLPTILKILLDNTDVIGEVVSLIRTPDGKINVISLRDAAREDFQEDLTAIAAIRARIEDNG